MTQTIRSPGKTHQFSLAVAARLHVMTPDPTTLSNNDLALALVDSLGRRSPIDVGVYAMLLHERGIDDDSLARLALRPLLDRIRMETAQLEASAASPTPSEPYGYWQDGEWYGYTPEEHTLHVGETITLTPVWTHGEQVTFVGVAVPGSDDVEAQPASEEDAALLRRFGECEARA